MNEQAREKLQQLAGYIEASVKSWERRTPASVFALDTVKSWRQRANALGSPVSLDTAIDLIYGDAPVKGIALTPNWPATLVELRRVAQELRAETHVEPIEPSDIRRNRAALKSTTVVPGNSVKITYTLKRKSESERQLNTLRTTARVLGSYFQQYPDDLSGFKREAYNFGKTIRMLSQHYPELRKLHSFQVMLGVARPRTIMLNVERKTMSTWAKKMMEAIDKVLGTLDRLYTTLYQRMGESSEIYYNPSGTPGSHNRGKATKVNDPLRGIVWLAKESTKAQGLAKQGRLTEGWLAQFLMKINNMMSATGVTLSAKKELQNAWMHVKLAIKYMDENPELVVKELQLTHFRLRAAAKEVLKNDD